MGELESLATTADLDDRNIKWDVEHPNTVNVEYLLKSASAAIVDAAGCIIGMRETSIDVPGGCREWLDLPAPVMEVNSVQIAGVTVTDWKLRSGRLWRSAGWNPGHGNDVTVDGIFGSEYVPADIVDLCCSLVAGAIASAEENYDPKRGLTSMGIDDYREGYSRGDDEIINPMQLPERTRQWLRQRFGGGTYTVGVY